MFDLCRLSRGSALTHQAPPARIFQAEQRDSAPPCRQTALALRRNQQSPQAAEAVRIDEACGYQFSKGILGLRSQRPRTCCNVVEERGAVSSQVLEHCLRRMRQIQLIARRRG